MKQLFVLLFFVLSLFSSSLQPRYEVVSEEINASIIDPDIDEDFTFYHFSKNNHQKAFSAGTLIKIFAEHNVKLESTYKGIVHFKRAVSMDLDPLKEKIKAYYLSHYPSMQIHYIDLHFNGYMEDLPASYTLKFKTNAYQHKYSTFKLSATDSKKRYFISYEISATISLYKASHNINRGKILSQIDMIYAPVTFKRLKGVPIKNLIGKQFRLKKRLGKGAIIYEHDIEPLPSVLKDRYVNVRYINNNVQLEFQATATQDARVGEQVYVQRKDGKRLKVKVVGKNLVEIE